MFKLFWKHAFYDWALSGQMDWELHFRYNPLIIVHNFGTSFLIQFFYYRVWKFLRKTRMCGQDNRPVCAYSCCHDIRNASYGQFVRQRSCWIGAWKYWFLRRNCDYSVSSGEKLLGVHSYIPYIVATPVYLFKLFDHLVSSARHTTQRKATWKWVFLRIHPINRSGRKCVHSCLPTHEWKFPPPNPANNHCGGNRRLDNSPSCGFLELCSRHLRRTHHRQPTFLFGSNGCGVREGKTIRPSCHEGNIQPINFPVGLLYCVQLLFRLVHDVFFL